MIVAAGLAVYGNSLHGPFIFDDEEAIVENAHVRQLWPISAAMSAPPDTSVSGRPIVSLSLAVNYYFGKYDVWGYHAFNLAVHLLTALLLLAVLRRTLASALLPDAVRRSAGGLAAASALLWTVHPLNSEAVVYVVQRTELLMAFFYLLTLYCFLRASAFFHHQDTKTQRAETESRWLRFWCAAAVLACALGMGCKEVMVTAPLVVLLYDRTFVAGSFREALRRRPGLYAGLFATWGILAFLIAGGPRTESVGFALGLTPAQYLMAQSRVILYYLGLAFWPSPLVIAYHWNVYPTLAENLPYVLAVAGAGALAAWALLRKPAPAAGKSALGFAGAWFFLILAPTSSFVPIVTEVAAERRMYLPLAAIVAVAAITAWLAGAWLTRRLAASERARKLLGRGLALALVLPPAAGLGRLTHLRNEDYRTEVSIWEDAARKQPGSPRAWNNLAHACSREGRQQEAIEYYSRAIEMKPDYADAWYNRGQVYGGLGQYDQAIRDYGEAIRWNPDFALAFGARGHIECVLGRYEDAVHDYDRAIELNRNYVEAYNGRGNAYSETSRLTEAIGDYGKALALDAGYAEAYYNRADAYGRSGRWDLAAGDYDQFIELRPDFAAAYNKRAVACYQMKEYGKALADVKKFQELGGQPHPDFLKALLKAAGRSE